ncbi:MAG: DUF4388 domain-containing protein [Chitinivibrionales bacterium]
MSISGNLRDFDISYIYQIISQEHKTGRLVLTCDEAEVYVVFNRGMVVYAGDNRYNIPAMLYRYALTVKPAAQRKVHDLSRRYKGDFKSFANHLISDEILSSDDVTLFIETTLEDLACNLFFWEHGYYHFDVLSQVDHLQFAHIALSADAITMEAARRIDEWRQIREQITDGMVFIKSPDVSDTNQSESLCPLRQTADFILKHIDGTTSVGYLSRSLFFSEYRVMDCLNELKAQKKIIALSEKYSRSIHAALERNSDQKDIAVSASFFSSLIVAAIASLVVILGSGVLRGHIMKEKIIEKRKTERHLERIQSENKVSIASLLYHAENGTPLTNIEELVHQRYITKRDLPKADSWAR